MSNVTNYIEENFDSLKHFIFFLKLAESNGEKCSADYYKEGPYELTETSRKTKKFEEKGLITREQDGRKKMIYLDDTGKELLEKLQNEAYRLLERTE